MENSALEKLVVGELDELGFECVKLEVVGSHSNPVVRLYIDKPGGVTIKDCSLVSKTLGLVLDREDPFPGRFLLEVSSPGSNRPLVKAEHYQRYEGENARVTVVRDGEKNTYTGKIRSCINDVLTLDTGEDELHLPLSSILKAQLADQEYKIDKKRKKEKRTRRRDKNAR